jgi:hypothetical protein
MNVFAAIEDACAAFVERTFARVFPSNVSPAQIGRKLVATMQSAPADTYLVRLHSRDLGGLGPERASFEREWSILLERTASALGLDLRRPLRAILHADDSVVAGTVAIDPVVDDGEAASARPYVVRVHRGLPLGAAWPLEGSLIVGRAVENGVDLADPRVSRRHACITRTGDAVVIEDLGSTNGTYVNGARIAEPRPIVPGDRIGLGDTELRLEIGDG